VPPAQAPAYEDPRLAPYDRYSSALHALPAPLDEHAGYEHLLGATTAPRSLGAQGLPDSLHKHFAALAKLGGRQVGPDDPIYKGIPQKYVCRSRRQFSRRQHPPPSPSP
jgi:hypothetical protein